jgi:hypothetical protein
LDRRARLRICGKQPQESRMTMTPTLPARPPLALRLLYAVPLLGWIARDISRDVSNVFYAVVILVTLATLGVMTWGPVVLTMLALACVPLMFVYFVAISWPFGKG